MKKLIFVTFLIFNTTHMSHGQELDLMRKQTFSGQWISHPSASLTAYGVFHFRKIVELDKKPEKFIIHITADNRYRLFINERSVCFGPARGDKKNWYYETIDISDFLDKGENIIAAIVWNMGEHAPVAQHSSRTGFLLWAENKLHEDINTNSSWKVFQNESYSPVAVKLRGYYAAGACEKVNGKKYPWGWQSPYFDDKEWKNANKIGTATQKGYLYGNDWQLVPRIIPLMEESPESAFSIKLAENIELSRGEYDFSTPIIIPANQKISIYFDQGYLTTGYPVLNVSKGDNSKISTTYAEAAFINSDTSTWEYLFIKEDRNEIERKIFEGTKDIFIPDGGESRTFSPLWMRCWRYIKMDIETGDEELIIENYSGIFSAYPFEQKAYFKTDNEDLQPIWDVSWRTARLCAGETYFDCPYYEQLQYVGDTRIQALISLYITGDDRLMKQAITQLDYSRFNEGLTFSRYPSRTQQVIPPFSLYWIDMIYDHWMHIGDISFIEQFLPGIRTVINWYLQYMDESGMPGHFDKWWFFNDWAKEFESGIPMGAHTGYNSIIALHFAYTLEHAAAIMTVCNKRETSEWYAQLASTVKQSVIKKCYHAEKDLIAQTPEQKEFSQHSSIIGVLTNAIEDTAQQNTIERIIHDTSLIQSTIYYRFYLFQAMQKTGLADQYLNQLGDWRFMLSQNLSTFAEEKMNTRSDCHAWSASPLYDFLATVCGVRPLEPGFKKFEIKPSFGTLKQIEAGMPTKFGMIHLDLNKKGKFGVAGKIEIPENTEAVFVWNGKTIRYGSGKHKIFIK